ncbi:peptidylprolyl isomerase FKBP-type [Methanohalophilus mahii DSM 5219]|uniref:Peptidyl-prolyl cis-trans isomerase n=2 Tax=Methanohalophilus mahii TaxID=2176 RepID=D5E9W0_METMS|nr:peptidylprolyl isomerase FKBP-type [Methanohalophilus mahii DSM 5219]
MRPKILITTILLGCILLFSGCADVDDTLSETVVEEGDTVALDFTLMQEDGTVVETSSEDVAAENNIEATPQLLEFKAGSEQMLPGINEGIIGMSEGEEDTLTLSPEEAFGPYQDELVESMPIEEYQNATGTNETPEVGQQMITQMGTVTVSDINDTHIELDANPPLAGETIVFEFTVESIEKADDASNIGAEEMPEEGVPEMPEEEF